MDDTVPPEPGAPETMAIPVFVALAGIQGEKICSSMPMPEANGATHMIELSVAVITPVMVFVTVAAAVALARIE